MGFTIEDLAIEADTDEDGYNSETFKAAIEGYLPVLIASEDNSTLTMENLEHRKYTNDLAGWLLYNNIAEKYHWVIARMNGLASPYTYDGTRKIFILPDFDLIDSILTRSKS